jgi:hypothetical protein
VVAETLKQNNMVITSAGLVGIGVTDPQVYGGQLTILPNEGGLGIYIVGNTSAVGGGADGILSYGGDSTGSSAGVGAEFLPADLPKTQVAGVTALTRSAGVPIRDHPATPVILPAMLR